MILQMAARNVVRNRRRSLITLIAIGMAVAVLVFVRGTLNGLQRLLVDRVVYGQTGVVQVHKRGFIDNVKKSPLVYGFGDDVAAKVRAVPGVEAVAPRIMFATMVNARDTTLFSLAIGVDPANEYEVCPQKLKEGPAVQAGKGVLSPELRDQLGLKSGEEVTLLAPDADGTLNASLLAAGGFFTDSPAFSGDKKLLLAPIEVAQSLVRLDGQVTELAVKGGEAERPDALKSRIEAALGADYEVHTWRELSKFAVDALNNQEAGLGFVIVVFSLVALFGILNTMMMSVLARTKEIGTMMAVGVRRRSILGLIVSESAMLGALGAFFGGAVGVVVVLVSSKIGFSLRPPGSSLPDTVRPVIGAAFVMKTVVYAGVGAAIAAIYPAYRASKLTPVKALGAL